MQFDQAVALLKAFEIDFSVKQEWRGEVGPDRGPHDLKLFTAVKLPFDPETWVHLCTTEGEYYVGGCCGTTSHIQDKINHIFRMESGWVSVKDLESLAVSWMGHDGADSLFTEPGWKEVFKAMPWDLPEKFDPTLEDGEPWTLMALIWHIVKDCYEPDVPGAYGNHMSELDKAVSMLSRAFSSLSWTRLFNKHEDEDKEPTTPFRGNRALMLSRLLPALATFNDQLSTLDLGDVEGFGLFDLEGDEIASNGYGLCVYETLAEAEKMMAQWREADDEYEDENDKRKPIDQRIEVRPVRITKEGGIEWTK